MKKVVISGSSSLQEKVKYWKKFWEDKGFLVLNYPKGIPKEILLDEYPKVHKKFFEDIAEADIHFIMNEDKKGIVGYVGAGTFSEMTFCIVQNLIYGKKIEIVLLKKPEEKVNSFEEIDLWLKIGGIKLLDDFNKNI